MTEAVKHAEDAIAGRIDRAIGMSEMLAYKRFVSDLDRQGADDFPYIFNESKAKKITDFAEVLTLAEGDKPQPFVCKGFQYFYFQNWNGWVHKDSGCRRFQTSYIQVARQNGKSVGNAIPSMYYGNFDNYQYPMIMAAATKEMQSRIIIRECKKFIEADKELSGTKSKTGLFSLQEYKSEIKCNLTGGTIKAVGRDTSTLDGFRCLFSSVDEYHAHPTNQMMKLLSDGAKNLPEHLVSVITTAGFNLNCPCKELYDYCKNVLYGVVQDETQFIFICELDKEDLIGDGIWKEQNWEKANPLWTPQRLDNLRSDAIKAREMGGEELRNFMTKSLNIWVQDRDSQYLNMLNWKACESDTTLEDMRGRECNLGLDLSSGGDLTTGVLEFPLDIDGSRKYFLSSHSFMPKNRLAEHIKTDKAPYDMWVREKLITLTETLSGVKTDYKYIISYYKKLIEQYDLKLKIIAYDPHNADAFLADLETFGCDCTLIVQSAKSLNDATVDFKLEVDAGNIIYDKRDKVLSWSFGYATTVSNSFGEIKLDKENGAHSSKRIDPCDACIDAHKVTILNRPEYNPNPYADSDFLKKLWGV